MNSAESLTGVLLPKEARGARLAELLEAGGDRCSHVQSSEELHALLVSRPLVMLVLAQRLGGFLSGLDILEKLNTDLFRPASILVGSLSPQEKQKAEKLGVAAVVDEGTSLEDLHALVRSRLLRLQFSPNAVPVQARRFVANADIIQPIPQLITRLCTYLQDESTSLNQLAEDIAVDARVTAELLKLSNSTALGLGRRVTSVPEAVKYLGVRRTIATVLAAGVLKTERGLCQGLPEVVRSWYQMRSVLIACTAAAVAQTIEGVSPDTAHVLGLLQDLGALVLAKSDPRKYEQIHWRVSTVGHARLEVLEREDFGVSHADVSAALLEMWEVPSSLVSLVLDHHPPERRASLTEVERKFLTCMRIGEAVANIAENRSPQRQQVLGSLLSPYGRGRLEDCRYCFATASAKAQKHATLFSIPLPDGDAVQNLLSELSDNLLVNHVSEELGEVTSAARPRILVIEDMPEMVQLLRNLLEPAGFTVIDGMAGCDEPRLQNDVDLVLCDVHLRVGTGLEVIAQLRGAGVDAPVIMMSGDRRRDTVAKCIESGVVDYLLKPFTRATLLEKVREAIGKRSEVTAVLCSG